MKTLSAKRTNFKLTQIALLVIFLSALLFRFCFFPDNIYFGFDEARDAFISQEIIKNFDVKLIGPPTDLAGVFHGPLFYYLIGPIYLLSSGSPELPFAFLVIANALGVFLTYQIARLLFDSKIGLLSALIYAFSFEQYQYSHYLGNPSLAVLSTLLFYLGSVLFFLKRKPWGLVLTAVGLATAVQFQFFMGYLAVVFLLYLIVFRTSLLAVKKWNFLALGAFFLLIFNFVLAELKFKFRMTRSILAFATDEKWGLYNVSEKMLIFFEKLVQHIYLNLFGFSLFFAGVILITVLLLISRKRKLSKEILFLLIWIFGPLILYFAPIETHNYFMTNIGVAVGITVLILYFLTQHIKSTFLLLAFLALILLGNVKLLHAQGSKGLVWRLFKVQEDFLLKDSRQLVEYTYENVKGQPFEIKTLSMPLKIQTTWAYLYDLYGKQKYGYFPYYVEGNVLGYPGMLPESSDLVCIRYLITEPTGGIGEWFIGTFFAEEDSYSELVFEKQFGALTLQKRLPFTCKED